MLKRSFRAAALIASALICAVPAMAGDDHRDVTVEIEGEDGVTMSLSISAGFVDGLIEGLSGANMDCEVTSDEETRAMLEQLSRKGKGSRYTLRRDEGEIIKARRRKGQLELEIVKPGAKTTSVSLPWSLGECMLGRDVPELSAEDRLALSVEQDGAIRIRVER